MGCLFVFCGVAEVVPKLDHLTLRWLFAKIVVTCSDSLISITVIATDIIFTSMNAEFIILESMRLFKAVI